jgi:hypothetical protein
MSWPEECRDFLEMTPSGYCLDGFVATPEESRILGEVLRGHTVPTRFVDALLTDAGAGETSPTPSAARVSL